MQTKDRFFAKVRKTDGCWLWTAGKYGQYGYGGFWWMGRTHTAHGVSWVLHCGPIPSGLSILHRCDIPLCVNPSHLFVGTRKDNLQDANNKGRWPSYGVSNGSAKLDRDRVEQIRFLFCSGASLRALAKQFGVHHRTIFKIVHGKLWTKCLK